MNVCNENRECDSAFQSLILLMYRFRCGRKVRLRRNGNFSTVSIIVKVPSNIPPTVGESGKQMSFNVFGNCVL